MYQAIHLGNVQNVSQVVAISRARVVRHHEELLNRLHLRHLLQFHSGRLLVVPHLRVRPLVVMLLLIGHAEPGRRGILVLEVHGVALSPRGHQLRVAQHRLSLHVLWHSSHHHHQLLLLLLVVHDLVQDVHVLAPGSTIRIEHRGGTVVLPRLLTF